MHNDRGNQAESDRLLRDAINLCTDPKAEWVKPLALAFAIHDACDSADAPAARKWLAAAKKEETVDWHLAHAAVLHQEGNTETAHVAWLSAQEAAAKKPRCGAYDQEREQVQMMGARWFQGAKQTLPMAA